MARLVPADLVRFAGYMLQDHDGGVAEIEFPAHSAMRLDNRSAPRFHWCRSRLSLPTFWLSRDVAPAILSRGACADGSGVATRPVVIRETTEGPLVTSVATV